MICKTPILLDRLPDPEVATPGGNQSASGYFLVGGTLDYVTSLPVSELEYLPAGESEQEAEILSRLRDYLSGTIPLCTFANSFAAFCMRTAAGYVEKDYDPDEPTTPIPPVGDPLPVGDDDLPF